jgi:arylsulfatase A-like enzyme
MARRAENGQTGPANGKSIALSHKHQIQPADAGHGGQIVLPKPLSMKQSGKRFVCGAAWGMLSWQAYFVGEYAATTIAPLLKDRNTAPSELHWKLSLLLLGIYSLAGLVNGGLASVFLGAGKSTVTEWRTRSIASLTLVLALLVNLVSVGTYRTSIVGTILLGAVLVWAFLSETNSRRLHLLSNPWVVAVSQILLIRVGSSLVNRGLVVQLSVGTVFAAVVAALCIFKSRMWAPAKPPRLALQAIVLLAALCATFGATTILTARNQHREFRKREFNAKASSPNVIFIVMDTVRADHLSLYGYHQLTSPQLQKLATSATYYPHAYAAGNGTLVSHSAMFTGTYASWNGVRSYSLGTSTHAAGPIRPEFPTAAEILSQHGYLTMAVVANTAFLTPAFGFHRGFDWFDSTFALPMHTGTADSYFLRHGARDVISRFSCVAAFDSRYFSAGEINRKAMKLLDQPSVAQRPFFLFLNYMDAHGPYVAPPPYDSRFPGNDCPSVAGEVPQQSERLRRHNISQYDGGIAYEDAEIGHLVSYLKHRGLYENTLLIITSDHGEAFGEGNRYGHGQTVYADQVRVPLLIKFPHANDGRVIDRSIGHTDLLPTMLQSAGIALPDIAKSGAAAGGNEEGDHKLVSEDLESEPPHRALYAGDRKFVASTSGMRQLYDVVADPSEQTDLCSRETDRCSQMRRDLEEWIGSIPYRPKLNKQTDRKTLDRLKSLGYVAR